MIIKRQVCGGEAMLKRREAVGVQWLYGMERGGAASSSMASFIPALFGSSAALYVWWWAYPYAKAASSYNVLKL